ncbi:hypothetical protein M758_1G250600 [Ceratodon purpureus]|nr:hypothetical protein M758_1G250600 [Ceratodon purpureus]
MVPPRKRKMAQTYPSTTTLSVGNCIIEFPSDADQELSYEALSLQVNQFASIKISVDKSKPQAPETPKPATRDSVLPLDLSFQLINPKGILEKINRELLEGATELYKKELPAMSFAADTGKESDFLRNTTMNGKYCTLLMKKSGISPADPEVVVGAITYQILPTSTQYAEIPLAAVDQSCQRQGLGSLLVKEMARRLMDVGVLTLFCWGDQESERFWNKQGFLKVGEVDAQGKPQKLRLKNEIRKAMSLPGNSALMVCNVPQVGSPTLPLSAGDYTPLRARGSKNAVHTAEKEAKTTSKITPAEAQESPVAHSDVSNLYSFGNNPSEVPLSSDVSPAAEVISVSSPNPVSAGRKLKTYARGSSSKLSTNPTPSSKVSSAKSNRTLRFAGVDSATATGKETVGRETAASPGQVQVVAPARENSGPVLESPTAQICKEKVSSTSSVDTITHSDIEFREPLRNVQNTCVKDIVAPVKKRPWKRTQCDNPNVAIAVQEPVSTGSDLEPEKENKEPTREKVLETDAEVDGETLKSCLKRPRAATLPVKTIGRRSVRRRRSESPSPINLVFQSPEPSAPERTPILEKPQVVASNDGADLNPKAVAGSRDTKIVACKQSMADESFSPSGVGEDHFNLRLETQGKDSTIRKRLSTRLVHVPDVGEDSVVASGYRKDSATVTPPIVFLSSMSNDPKKRALAQLVEKLGGKVAGTGGECTHVVASEVRRTINFCTALCNGAWVVTPDWLKASSRHKSFVDEKSHILRDKLYESKYKVSLPNVIQAAQRRPGALFTGFSVYPTPHVQPPLETVTKLTQVAGGTILSSLAEALQQEDLSHTIVLVGEEDKEEGVLAEKAGLRTFTGEWLMQAIVKQKIDLDVKVPNDH